MSVTVVIMFVDSVLYSCVELICSVDFTNIVIDTNIISLYTATCCNYLGWASALSSHSKKVLPELAPIILKEAAKKINMAIVCISNLCP